MVCLYDDQKTQHLQFVAIYNSDIKKYYMCRREQKEKEKNILDIN